MRDNTYAMQEHHSRPGRLLHVGVIGGRLIKRSSVPGPRDDVPAPTPLGKSFINLSGEVPNILAPIRPLLGRSVRYGSDVVGSFNNHPLRPVPTIFTSCSDHSALHMASTFH
jgi:hypothetical protein